MSIFIFRKLLFCYWIPIPSKFLLMLPCSKLLAFMNPERLDAATSSAHLAINLKLTCLLIYQHKVIRDTLLTFLLLDIFWFCSLQHLLVAHKDLNMADKDNLLSFLVLTSTENSSQYVICGLMHYLMSIQSLFHNS